MFLSVRLNFRRPIYPGFYSFAKIFQTLSRDSPALGSTKLPVGTKVVPIFVNQTHSIAILITGRTLRNWFPFDSWNVGLSLVVCQVKDHVPKFAFVHELIAFRTLKEVFFFLVA
jgi:hypothetical protein